MPATRAKGTLLVHAKQWVLSNRGENAWRALVDALAPAERPAVDGLVLVSAWYPIALWNRLMHAFLQQHDAERVVELARYVALQDLNIVFKMVLKMGTPAMVLRRTEALYGRYFEAGTFKTCEVSPRRWRLTLDAPMADDEGPSEETCALGVPGWIEEGMRLTGAKNPRLDHLRCRFKQALHCEYDATW